MEKIVRVGDYQFPVKSFAASLFSYRRNFGRDGMKDLMALVSGMGRKKQKGKKHHEGNKNGHVSDEDVINVFTRSSFEIDTLYRFVWVFAKAADPQIPPMEEWLDTFEVNPFTFISEAFPQMEELLFSMAKTTVPAKKN